jgi:hypothetical protein
LSTTNPTEDSLLNESKKDLKNLTDLYQPSTQTTASNKSSRLNKLSNPSKNQQMLSTPTSSNSRPTSIDQKFNQDNNGNDLNLNHHLQNSNAHFANYQAMFSPTANMLAAAAAAALAYPPSQSVLSSSNKTANFAASPFMTYVQQPFNNVAAMAAYSSYLNSKPEYPVFGSFAASGLNINSLNNTNMA